MNSTANRSRQSTSASSSRSARTAGRSSAKPASLPSGSSIVTIRNGKTVELAGFVISGPNPMGTGDNLLAGVLVRDSATADIHDNEIRDIRNNPLDGVQTGFGILVGQASPATSGTATIRDNILIGYQKNGMVISNSGSQADITDNVVTGAGPTGLIVQNGIQVSDAAVTLLRNRVSGHLFTDTNIAISVGILGLDPSSLQVTLNRSESNDENLFLVNADGATIDRNILNSGTFDGMFLDGTNAASISRNQADNNGDVGIYLCTTSFGCGESSGNTLTRNRANTNTDFDCLDESTGSGTAGTANTWTNNTGDLASPPDICEGSGPNSTRAGAATARGERGKPRPAR